MGATHYEWYDLMWMRRYLHKESIKNAQDFNNNLTAQSAQKQQKYKIHSCVYSSWVRYNFV